MTTPGSYRPSSEDIQALLRHRRRQQASNRYRITRRGISLLKIAGYITFFGALMAGFWLLASLWLMLGIGVAHAEWWHAIPTMSYQAALLIDFFIGGWVGMSVAVSAKSRSKN